MKFKKSTAIIIIIMISFSLVACSRKDKKEEVEKYTRNFIALGTFIHISVFSDNEKEANRILLEGEKRVNEIEGKMSINIDKSEISMLNANRQGKVSEENLYVVKTALKYAALSNGKFDITVDPLARLWGIGTDNAQIPSLEDINTARALVNYKTVHIEENNKKITLGKDQALDLGAIAKGYTADEIRKVFVKNGIKSGCINLGGNIMTIGSKMDGSKWNIGIQDPLASRDEYLGIVKGTDLSVVTSGNYERYFERDGVRYHHILDVATGYPSKTGVISTTIISKNGIDGDALSTAAFTLGVEEGIKLIESIDGVDAIFVTEDRMVYTTSKIQDKFELTNDNFEIVK